MTQIDKKNMDQKNWHKRYKAMKKNLRLTNADIGEIIGNKGTSIRNVTQSNKPFPRWAKLSIYIYERLTKE